ncbi:MAG: SDR family NAD(P)-dependent oxidoreductase [Oceanicaulis sp.]|uniref:SDR family NAD(P)-dependent oxidoreductase n=1 Tax=Glycocaulis sp. TaxID=1969725 RepID=UPI0025C54189|nr:SDR family NAD(P)-dependent oxidoreductase [Glycocaulis sp.]MCC5980654.1 SDR family NAD(P)-dependent oxidoreductase [Oceanicaulis sp.]MCH8521881.1 SDR family NAD(P)-dependent oxidoreductase [Glycocaulis sp.]
MTDTKLLSGRVALVTGASRGLGYATAKALAAQGAHVIATARTRGGLEALDDEISAAGGSATLVPMDLMAPDGIEKLAEAVQGRWGKLDILIANAGSLGKLMPAQQLPSKVWNEVLAVNLVAPARLIRAFEPLLRSSDAGRAVFLTTSQGAKTRAYWAAYGASKAGLEALVKSWAAELAESSVRVNLLDPGRMRTAMRTRAVPGENPETVPLPETVTPLLVELASPGETRHGEVVRAGQ